MYDGDKTTFTADQALGEGGPKIRFYWETTLKWTIKVKNKAGNWVNALGGATTLDTIHRSLCVANEKPIIPVYADREINIDNVAWEKVMQYSCDWAKGQGGANVAEKKAVVEALWSGIDHVDTSGTGARHNINYTFVSQPAFNVRSFLKAGCRGSCGHHARFFSEIGAAHGLRVDVVSMMLQPSGVGEAYHIAVSVPDVDGDYCEYVNGPVVGGNALWWYNSPLGSGGLQHSATQYDDGTGVTVYDPTFGVKHAGTWNSYLSSSIAYYWIRTAATAGTWKTKATVNADGNTVRWQPLKNYAADGGQIVWRPVP